MRNCQRCVTGEVSWTSDTVSLIGDVPATLCNPCRVEWASIVRDCPAWQRKVELEARQAHYESLARAGTPVTEADWFALLRDQDANVNEFHAVAVEFVKPVASPVPAAERDT
jgi:hypothetical protein